VHDDATETNPNSHGHDNNNNEPYQNPFTDDNEIFLDSINVNDEDKNKTTKQLDHCHYKENMERGHHLFEINFVHNQKNDTEQKKIYQIMIKPK